jgi:lysyl-tRNA synthetase, class II
MAEDQIQARRMKRDALRAAGRNPYPDRWDRTHSLEEAKPLADATDGVRVAGRVMLLRVISKKMIFLTLQDRSGRLQISLRLPTMPDAELAVLRDALDLGDFLGVRGAMWTTRTGEKTLDAQEAVILAKALRPMPAKWEGVADREIGYRQRYLDLLTNDETRARFRLRTRVVRSIREYLDGHGFEEVETPILCTKASGALAKPFFTHHNALDLDVVLRIAPETYLKRLVVGGYERVYEFARCFRNEGMDPSHLQDFTMLEYYVAYWSYEENMAFTRELVQHAVRESTGTLTFTRPGPKGEGTVTIDLGGEWPRLRIVDLIRERTGLDVRETRDPAALRQWIREHGHADDDVATMAYASLVDHIYKKTVRPTLVQPCFVVGHPIELSPLARRNDADPGITDRFQLLINGWEVVNAYSELVDPDDQRGRFEEQARAKQAGDEEAMEAEDDYLVCMEHGMPPTSGWGMGIDRLVTLLSGQENLRDAVLFPLMRPESS